MAPSLLGCLLALTVALPAARAAGPAALWAPWLRTPFPLPAGTARAPAAVAAPAEAGPPPATSSPLRERPYFCL